MKSHLDKKKRLLLHIMWYVDCILDTTLQNFTLMSSCSNTTYREWGRRAVRPLHCMSGVNVLAKWGKYIEYEVWEARTKTIDQNAEV